MAASTDSGSGVRSYRRTTLERALFSLAIAGLALLLCHWPDLGHQVAAGWQVVAVGVTFVATWWLSSRSGLDVDPGFGFAIRGVLRTDWVPFDQVHAVEPVRSWLGTRRLVLSSRLGCWTLAAPTSFGGAAIDADLAAIHGVWSASGSQRAEPGLEPWGPDPGGRGQVTFRLSPAQGFGAPQPLPWLLGRSWAIYSLFFAAACLVHGVDAWWAVAALAVVLIVFARGPRTIVGADGIELRRLVRSTFVPWSMIRAVTTASPRASRRRDSVHVIGLVTPNGWYELPAPIGGTTAPDPQFWRKLRFIEDCWSARRGPAWVGPPAPPPLPPPPRVS